MLGVIRREILELSTPSIIISSGILLPIFVTILEAVAASLSFLAKIASVSGLSNKNLAKLSCHRSSSQPAKVCSRTFSLLRP